jgi:hypothetical protein
MEHPDDPNWDEDDVSRKKKRVAYWRV